MPFKGDSCNEHVGKVAAMTLKEPPGCNLRSNVPKKHPENAFRALDSVDTIGGQGQPSIFAEADSVSTSQCSCTV
jgi:hypothetical protein